MVASVGLQWQWSRKAVSTWGLTSSSMCVISRVWWSWYSAGWMERAQVRCKYIRRIFAEGLVLCEYFKFTFKECWSTQLHYSPEVVSRKVADDINETISSAFLQMHNYATYICYVYLAKLNIKKLLLPFKRLIVRDFTGVHLYVSHLDTHILYRSGDRFSLVMDGAAGFAIESLTHGTLFRAK